MIIAGSSGRERESAMLTSSGSASSNFLGTGAVNGLWVTRLRPAPGWLRNCGAAKEATTPPRNSNITCTQPTQVTQYKGQGKVLIKNAFRVWTPVWALIERCNVWVNLAQNVCLASTLDKVKLWTITKAGFVLSKGESRTLACWSRNLGIPYLWFFCHTRVDQSLRHSTINLSKWHNGAWLNCPCGYPLRYP